MNILKGFFGGVMHYLKIGREQIKTAWIKFLSSNIISILMVKFLKS